MATSRSSLATADKGHLHHRLINLGHGHRRSVLILWTWTALLSGFVLYPVLTDQNPSYLPFGMAALAIVLYTVLHPSVLAQRRRNNTPAEGIERLRRRHCGRLSENHDAGQQFELQI